MVSKKSQKVLGVNHAMEEYFKAQEKKFYEFLNDKTATASVVSKVIGIDHKNLTRFKRNLEKKGVLQEVRYVKCPLTRHFAWEITTDPKRFPTVIQLSLFDND